MTPLPARRDETSDGGLPLVLFVDEAAALLGALRHLPLYFPACLTWRESPNRTKEDR